MKITNEIQKALNNGLEIKANLHSIVKSKNLDKKYILVKNNESNFYALIDSNNPFYIDKNEYLDYRIKYKYLVFGSMYTINKYLGK